MKSIVIYHSLSGSTKKIAEAIHRGMRETGELCDISRLRDLDPQDLIGYDLIGLGGWVKKLAPPEIITNFIRHALAP